MAGQYLLYNRAAGYSKSRRVVKKVEFHVGGLFPQVDFMVASRELQTRAVVRVGNMRGNTLEQWIKVSKLVVNSSRLSRHRFRGNEVRLWLGVIAYDLWNVLRRLECRTKLETGR